MLYDEIMKIVTLAGELMLQAQDEELTVFDKEGTANFVTKHDKEIQFYLSRSDKVWKNAVWLCLQPLHKRNVFRCERRRGEAERKRDSLFG